MIFSCKINLENWRNIFLADRDLSCFRNSSTDIFTREIEKHVFIIVSVNCNSDKIQLNPLFPIMIMNHIVHRPDPKILLIGTIRGGKV